MKPSRIAILIAVILLVVGGTTAFAASSSAVQPQPNTNCAFRDADGDGICDNCPAAQTTTSTRGQGNAWHHTEHAGHGHQTGHHWGGHHGC